MTVEQPTVERSDSIPTVDGDQVDGIVIPTLPSPPITSPPIYTGANEPVTATLLLSDGTAYQGYSFGAEQASIAGECVFQTGKSCLTGSVAAQ